MRSMGSQTSFGPIGALVIVACAALAACASRASTGPGTGTLDNRVAALDARLAKLEKLLQPMLEMPPPPDPQAVYAVPIEGSPAIGPAQAPVTLVEAFDFACPECLAKRPMLAALRKRFGDRLRIVYKFFIVHADVGTLPALAACAAAQQGKYEVMAELIWEQGVIVHDLGLGNLKKLAAQAALEPARFEADLGGPTCQQRLSADVAELTSLGVMGTPTFFVNGRPMPDTVDTVDAAAALIDQELAKAEAAIAAGTPAGEYYQVAVLGNGLKSTRPAAPAAQGTGSCGADDGSSPHAAKCSKK
jgi:protein-disulfide isomerase